VLAQCARSNEEMANPLDVRGALERRTWKAVAGRAQWKIYQPPSLKRQLVRSEGSFRGGVDEVRPIGIVLHIQTGARMKRLLGLEGFDWNEANLTKNWESTV